jgi:hypothetical protein
MDSEHGDEKPSHLEFEDVVRSVHRATLEQGGHNPTILAQGELCGGLLKIPDMPDTFEERVQVMYSAGMEMSEGNRLGALRQVFFISEGWMSDRPNPEDGPLKQLPSQDPQRREVLLVNNLDLTEQRFRLNISEMIRDGSGKLTQLRTHSDTSEVKSPLMLAFIQGFEAGQTPG